jgi:hypothetical protein
MYDQKCNKIYVKNKQQKNNLINIKMKAIESKVISESEGLQIATFLLKLHIVHSHNFNS